MTIKKITLNLSYINMTTMKPIRKLTVSYTYHSTQADYVEIPAIRLKGKWLTELGFVQGKKVAVETADKKLVITLLDEEEHTPDTGL